MRNVAKSAARRSLRLEVGQKQSPQTQIQTQTQTQTQIQS